MNALQNLELFVLELRALGWLGIKPPRDPQDRRGERMYPMSEAPVGYAKMVCLSEAAVMPCRMGQCERLILSSA